MNRLGRLTDEHLKAIPRVCDEWIDIGRSCEPTDYQRAKAAAKAQYRCRGFRAPLHWILAESPLSGTLSDAVMCHALGAWRAGYPMCERIVGHSAASSVMHRLMVVPDTEAVVSGSTQVRVHAQLHDKVVQSLSPFASLAIHDCAMRACRDVVFGQGFEGVWESVRRSTQHMIAESVWERIWDSDRGMIANHALAVALEAGLAASALGSQDAGWLSMHAFFNEACGIPLPERVAPLVELAQCCGWWIPRAHICTLQHRPAEWHDDDNGNLHCENGPAVRYRDGWSIWCINGVRVDYQIVMQPETQTTEQILNEPNAEVSRVRIDRFGWLRFLAETNAELVDSRDNPLENTKEMLCRVVNGTLVLVCHCPSQGKVFALPVPPEIDSCEQAQTYLHGGSSIDRLVGPLRTIGRS